LLQVDLSPLSRESLMAFAINMYNALVIHALVVHGPEQYNSPTGRIGFFQKVQLNFLCVLLKISRCSCQLSHMSFELVGCRVAATAVSIATRSFQLAVQHTGLDVV
jgi:hypothetical protein